MKKILLGFTLAVMTIACQEKKNGAFVVTGNIENAPGKKVMLIEMPFGNESPVILDSTFLKEDGQFTLRGRSDEEGIYRLAIENGPDVILVNDNKSIRVKMNVTDYRHYKIEGSPASQDLHRLFEDYHDKDSVLFTLFKQIDTLQKTPEMIA